MKKHLFFYKWTICFHFLCFSALELWTSFRFYKAVVVKQHNHDILGTVLLLYLCLVSNSDSILGEIHQSCTCSRGSQLEMHRPNLISYKLSTMGRILRVHSQDYQVLIPEVQINMKTDKVQWFFVSKVLSWAPSLVALYYNL